MSGGILELAEKQSVFQGNQLPAGYRACHIGNYCVTNLSAGGVGAHLYYITP